MDLNIISRKSGWFLSRITGALNLSEKIVITNFKSIKQYHLHPGTFVNIKDINNPKSHDKFMLIPFFDTINDTHDFLETFIQRLLQQKKYHKMDKSYLCFLRDLIDYFSASKKREKHLGFFEIEFKLERDKHQRDIIEIALPDFWLTNNDLLIGETVLLRNDCPSPVIA